MEAGGRQTPTRVPCSFFWPTTWSIWLKWLEALVLGCGQRSRSFRLQPWHRSRNPHNDAVGPAASIRILLMRNFLLLVIGAAVWIPAAYGAECDRACLKAVLD